MAVKETEFAVVKKVGNLEMNVEMEFVVVVKLV
jgi:hypothetical protein